MIRLGLLNTRLSGDQDMRQTAFEKVPEWMEGGHRDALQRRGAGGTATHFVMGQVFTTE